jgi:hypothetical protein
MAEFRVSGRLRGAVRLLPTLSQPCSGGWQSSGLAADFVVAVRLLPTLSQPCSGE